MTTADTGAPRAPDPPQPSVSVNGSVPAADPECETCVTKGERALAVFGGLVGAVIILIAVDLGSGGWLSSKVGLGPREGAPGDNSGS